MDNATARVISGVYMALTAALTDQGAQLAHDTLFDFAGDPDICAEDRRIFEKIAKAATQQVQPPQEYRPYEVIAGGVVG